MTPLKHPRLPFRIEHHVTLTAFLFILFLIILPSEAAQAQTGPCPGGLPLAFEGAEGYGRCSQGGRGGVTIDVTNLNNSGQGSLRQCAQETAGPRTCRIMVAGTASLGGYNIIVRNPYLTIDGSRYPFAIKDGGIAVRASHTIIRHLRIRPGPMSWLTRGAHANGISYLSVETGGQTSNHIADHVSVSWCTDDSIFVYFGTYNVTIQDSIMSEGLKAAADCPSCEGKGILMGSNGANGNEKVSVLRTLYAHNFIRFPQINGGTADFVNNVIYNGNATEPQILPVYGIVRINFVGNYFKDGPDVVPNNLGRAAIRTIGMQNFSAVSSIFVNDNWGRHYASGGGTTYGIAEPDRNIIWGDNGGIPVLSSRVPDPPLMTTVPVLQAYSLVLNSSGAQPRDSVDARVMADVRNGTGHRISNPLSVGGWPNLTGGVGDTTAPGPPANLRVY
jgi:pectate lyase